MKLMIQSGQAGYGVITGDGSCVADGLSQVEASEAMQLLYKLDLDDRPETGSPIFASEAQEVFTIGCRVYQNVAGGALEGVYLGVSKRFGVPLVAWDELGGLLDGGIRRAEFDSIRNLYR